MGNVPRWSSARRRAHTLRRLTQRKKVGVPKGAPEIQGARPGDCAPAAAVCAVADVATGTEKLPGSGEQSDLTAPAERAVVGARSSVPLRVLPPACAAAAPAPQPPPDAHKAVEVAEAAEAVICARSTLQLQASPPAGAAAAPASAPPSPPVAHEAVKVVEELAVHTSLPACAPAPAPPSPPVAHEAVRVFKEVAVHTSLPAGAAAPAPALPSPPAAHDAVRVFKEVAVHTSLPAGAAAPAPAPPSPPVAHEAVKVLKGVALQASLPAGAPAPAPPSPPVAHEAVRVFKATQRSAHFVNYVEYFALSKGCVAADDCVQERAGIALSREPQERKRQLIKVYTGNSLYGQMNACLNLDEPVEMRRYSGYIRETRDVFRTDDPHSAVSFHTGLVHRGIRVGDAAAYVKQFHRDEEFMWASFTSTSKSTSGAFSGGVRFEIQCSLGIDGKKAQYAPASVSHLSQYPKEDEVLFPPHVTFRVVNIKGDEVNKQGKVLKLETVEFPSVWGRIYARDWVSFKKWAAVNADRVDTRGCAFSMINAVAAVLVLEQLAAGDPAAPPMVDPLLVCLGCQADINEVDPETGTLPILTIARAAAQAAGAGALQMAEKLLRWCIGVGGNIFQKGGPDGQGEAAVDAYPKARELAEQVGREGFAWEYQVDDGVDGKEGGWYPYAEDACPKISTLYDAWRCDQSLSAQEVQSRGDSGTNFRYALDFASMTQTNKSTGKVRRIRRRALQV